MEGSPHNNLQQSKMETILVTGASSGMGREIAIRFSRTCRVILCGRNMERLQESLSRCSDRFNHVLWQFDLDNIDSIEGSLQNLLTSNDVKVTYFVHCAGYINTLPIKLVSSDVLRKTFYTNVFSAELIIKTLMMRKINRDILKSVVLISSNISNFGAVAHSVYGASKGALDSMMRSLAVELAPRVRVNSVLPGAVHTAMTEHIYGNEDLIHRMEATYPLGLGTTSDIADAVEFLLSDKARWITGQQLTVDGGRTINITG